MIADGYAYEYTYKSAYKYQAEFKGAQRSADNGDKGLWSPLACNGEAGALPSGGGDSVATSAPGGSGGSGSGVVKKSNSGICHGPGTKYYLQTKKFTPYNTIEECLAYGEPIILSNLLDN